MIWHGISGVCTSRLVPEIDGSAIVWSASHVAHASRRPGAPPAPFKKMSRIEILTSELAVGIECEERKMGMRWRACCGNTAKMMVAKERRR